MVEVGNYTPGDMIPKAEGDPVEVGKVYMLEFATDIPIPGYLLSTVANAIKAIGVLPGIDISWVSVETNYIMVQFLRTGVFALPIAPIIIAAIIAAIALVVLAIGVVITSVAIFEVSRKAPQSMAIVFVIAAGAVLAFALSTIMREKRLAKTKR